MTRTKRRATMPRCSWERCGRTTQQPPWDDGWAYLARWGAGIPDGWYRPAHAAALEAALVNGELEEASKC